VSEYIDIFLDRNDKGKSMNKLIWFYISLYTSVSFAQYSGYVHSLDGHDVACGGKYSGYTHSLDGKKVCAGGRNSGMQ